MNRDVTLTERTFALADRLKATFALIPQRPLNIVIHLIIPLIGLATLALVLSQNKPVTSQLVVVLAACFSFTPVFAVVIVLMGHFGTKAARDPFTYRFDENGIHVKAATHEFTHRWSGIRKITRFGGFLMLFYSPGLAHCLPLKWLSAAELQGIVALATAQGVKVKGHVI